MQNARKHGAKILTGGRTPNGLNGYFFEPTTITDMKPNMLISQEEIIAPICALYEFQTEEEAVRMANHTSMGLESYFFTKNVDRTWRLLGDLEAGMIGMNTGERLLD